MKDKRNRHGKNHLRNDIFVNLLPLPLLCEISGALHLAQPVLRQVVDEIQVNFKNFKLAVGQNIQLVALFNQGTASLQLYSSRFFSGKAYCKVDF